ncbi:MAG: hypothetical protein MJ003_01045 [Paludibacteraceae bacterium]|nr:hypothetical protein [Paludibacteraceae bacterium]
MKKNVFRLGLGVVLVTMLASCAKLGDMQPEYFNVNPNPLEVKAGKVEGTIAAKFPEKYFVKKAVIDITPVLRYEGGEAVGTTVSYQGEKVKGNDETIQYKAGGEGSMNFSFDYVPEMANSVLTLRFKAVVGSDEVEIPDLDIAVGCIATSTLASGANVKPAFAKDNFVRDTKELTEADVMFQIQQADVKNNDDVKALLKAEKDAAACDRRVVNGVSVVSAASPDGGAELNEKLAANRQKNTESFLKKQKSQAALDAQYIAQDWEGFQKLVNESNVKDKDLILRVLSSYADTETREKEIKNLSAAYTELASEILPKLRRSHITLDVTLKGKTDEEILALAENKPDSLNVEELMFAAKLACQAGNKEAAAKYTEANAKQNASDWRTSNNVAAIDLAKGDIAASQEALNQSVNNGGADKAEANFNLGLIALTNNDTEAAKQYFSKSAGVENLNEGQAVLYLEEGDYAKAVEAFGDTKSNNAGLAQILVGSYENAKNILNSVEKKDATTYYLLAICAARTAQDNDLFNNLRQAVAMDSNYASRAKSDLEFAKYWTVETFQAIAK